MGDHLGGMKGAIEKAKGLHLPEMQAFGKVFILKA